MVYVGLLKSTAKRLSGHCNARIITNGGFIQGIEAHLWPAHIVARNFLAFVEAEPSSARVDGSSLGAILRQNGNIHRGIATQGFYNISRFNEERKRKYTVAFRGNDILTPLSRSHSSDASRSGKGDPHVRDHSQTAVVIALWCNVMVFSLKCGVWLTSGSHVMLAEAVHSLADIANQALLAYGLISSRRAPDALHPYGYSKERFVWSLISAVGIFCLGSGATIIDGVSNLWHSKPVEHMMTAAIVLGGSMLMEGASLLVAINAVHKGASAEGMKFREYVWQGHDPTAVAIMMEDGAAVTGLVIAGISLTAVHITGNPIWDPIGSIIVGNLLGAVAIFLIQRNRHALLGRAMNPNDMKQVLDLLSCDPVVDAVYDCKSEVIGPGKFRFKAEIDFDGVVVVQNYLQRTGREVWMKEFRAAALDPDDSSLDRMLATYGEEVVAALGSEVDRLEKEIQSIMPGIRHVDIEAHNPKGPSP